MGKYKVPSLSEVLESEKRNLFEVVSLFAGGGGSSTGYRMSGAHVLAINEFVELAQETYRANYPDTIIFPGDIREITGGNILEKINKKRGELDCLDGSPPCSAFSTQGIREKGWGVEKNYSDTKQRVDDLFFEYARIVDDIAPKVFVAENVKGLTMGNAQDLLGKPSCDDDWGMGVRPDKGTFCRALEDCASEYGGYVITYKVMDGALYGVPQSRQRLIITGVRKDIAEKYNIKPSLPEGTLMYPIDGQKCLNPVITVKEAIKDIRHKLPDWLEDSTSARMQRIVKYPLGKLSKKKVAQKISDAMVKECGSGLFVSNYDRDNWFKPHATLTTFPRELHATLDRTLTIAEGKRIMSFPGDYKLMGNGMQRWERISRAVAPLMMKAIGEHLYENVFSKIR